VALERLQKILARAGVSSRRAAESLIEAGRVKVDGKVVTELGTKADPTRQRIEVDSKRIEAEALVYVLFHKPRKVMCTMRDPEGRETVADYMRQVSARVVPVGRLDYHTSGVLLLTNDGDFAAALAHPSKKVEKVYVAKVRGVLDADAMSRWQSSIDIDGKSTQPAEVRKLRVEGDKSWLEVTLREGKNRQIHRIGDDAGNPVLRLARVSFAGITHEGLKPGQWRYLSKDELTLLKKAHGVPKKIRPAPPLPNAKEVRKKRAQSGRSNRGVVTATKTKNAPRKALKARAAKAK
jgi:23S rRNA pseudouridine2605 synthase